MPLTITILGKVPKGDEVRKDFVDWKEEYVRAIGEYLPDANILHGDHIRDDVGPELVVGHDLWTVKNADVVMVDARGKIGAGTAQEMVMAKFFKVPVVSVIPKDTHHRRSNVAFDGAVVEDWIHPFLAVSSDFIAEDIAEAVQWVKQYANGSIAEPVKDIAVFENAIGRFEKELPDMAARYSNPDV